MSDIDTCLQPVKWRVIGIPSRIRNDPSWHPYIEERRQRDGSVMWVVTDMGEVLNRDGEWEWEPLPSSRDDAFLARTRYATPDAALAAIDRRFGITSSSSSSESSSRSLQDRKQR